MVLMRQIENDAKSQWDEVAKNKKYTGSKDDCLPAMLRGWTDNDPSLWELVEDPRKPSRLEILTALCRNKKDDWEKITYLTFDKKAIEETGLEITPSTGKTGDSKVDQSRTHYEIKGLTIKGLCALLYNITLSQFDIGIFKKSEYLAIIIKGYDNSRMAIVSKTQSMSVNPNSIIASTDTTVINDDGKKEIEKVFLPLTSQTGEVVKTNSSSDTSTKPGN